MLSVRPRRSRRAHDGHRHHVDELTCTLLQRVCRFPRVDWEWDAVTARRLTVNLAVLLGMVGDWTGALAMTAELTPDLERSEEGRNSQSCAQQAGLRVWRRVGDFAAPFADWLERLGFESQTP
jgi:hypothetical protein